MVVKISKSFKMKYLFDSMAEFNFYADPEAAHVVLKKLEGLTPLKATIVTWELCHSYFYISWVSRFPFNIF